MFEGDGHTACEHNAIGKIYPASEPGFVQNRCLDDNPTLVECVKIYSQVAFLTALTVQSLLRVASPQCCCIDATSLVQTQGHPMAPPRQS